LNRLTKDYMGAELRVFINKIARTGQAAFVDDDLQSGLGETVWDEAVQIGGPYGASILIHEIVEIRALQQAGVESYKGVPV